LERRNDAKPVCYACSSIQQVAKKSVRLTETDNQAYFDKTKPERKPVPSG